jgi:zinc protease
MISREDPDWYAAEVANYILGGGGFESRLMKAVRAEKGLSYGIGTGLAPMDKASLVAGSFAVNNDKAAQALDLLRAEWARLVREGAGAAEVEAAKAYLTGSWPLALTSLDAIAATLLDMREKELPSDYLDRRNALIQTVDTKAVQAVLARAFDPARLSFAVVGGAQGVQADETAEEVKD